MSTPFNTQVCMKLEEMAELLEQQNANPFRIRAYRHAAISLSGLQQDLAEIFQQEGNKGLQTLPGVGRGIANAIAEIITTGRWAQLERLRGSLDPVHLFQTVPGIGPDLAERIHEELHIDTLEALENAAFDGTLEKIKGIGNRRLTALRASLASMLGRARQQSRLSNTGGPEVSLLLEIDRQYLEQAFSGELPKIAPKRFNPSGEAWLPILHAEKDSWHFTALFSNTALARQLHKTNDWVIVYFYDDHQQEGQYTLVTETHGPLQGRRVVRGREAECRRFYQT